LVKNNDFVSLFFVSIIFGTENIGTERLAEGVQQRCHGCTNDFIRVFVAFLCIF